MVDIQLQIQNLVKLANAANNKLADIETTPGKHIRHRLEKTYTVYQKNYKTLSIEI